MPAIAPQLSEVAQRVADLGRADILSMLMGPVGRNHWDRALPQSGSCSVHTFDFGREFGYPLERGHSQGT